MDDTQFALVEHVEAGSADLGLSGDLAGHHFPSAHVHESVLPGKHPRDFRSLGGWWTNDHDPLRSLWGIRLDAELEHSCKFLEHLSLASVTIDFEVKVLINLSDTLDIHLVLSLKSLEMRLLLFTVQIEVP